MDANITSEPSKPLESKGKGKKLLSIVEKLSHVKDESDTIINDLLEPEVCDEKITNSSRIICIDDSDDDEVNETEKCEESSSCQIDKNPVEVSDDDKNTESPEIVCTEIAENLSEVSCSQITANSAEDSCDETVKIVEKSSKNSDENSEEGYCDEIIESLAKVPDNQMTENCAEISCHKTAKSPSEISGIHTAENSEDGSCEEIMENPIEVPDNQMIDSSAEISCSQIVKSPSEDSGNHIAEKSREDSCDEAMEIPEEATGNEITEISCDQITENPLESSNNQAAEKPEEGLSDEEVEIPTEVTSSKITENPTASSMVYQSNDDIKDMVSLDTSARIADLFITSLENDQVSDRTETREQVHSSPSNEEEKEQVNLETASKQDLNPNSFVRISSVTVPENLNEEQITEFNANDEEEVIVTVLPSDGMENDELADIAPYLYENTMQEEEANDMEGEDDIPSHVKCTACGIKVKTMKGKFCKHPVLGVLVCKACNKFYNSSSFKRDDYGMEEHCKWCGDGGDVIMCDFCEKVFCKKCVKRNMGKEFLKVLLESDDMKWQCFSCDPKQIESFTTKCQHVMSVVQKNKLKDFAFEDKKVHLGGPSQLERKERLNCISHSIEDGVEIPEDILKVEHHEAVEDRHVTHAKHHDKDHKKKNKESNKEKKKDSGHVSRRNREELSGKKERTGKDTAISKKLSNEDLEALKEEYSLKEFDITLEKVDIPEDCVRNEDIETSDIAIQANDSEGIIDDDDCGIDHEDDSIMIIDSDSDNIEGPILNEDDEDGGRNTGLTDDNMDVKDESVDSDEPDVKEEVKEENSDYGIDEVEGERMLASSNSDEGSDKSKDASERFSDSDSDSDGGILMNRSIRSDVKQKKSNKRNRKIMSASDESESEPQRRSSRKMDLESSSSDEQPIRPSTKQQQKDSRKKRARKSDSDSDFASRVKKRRKRRRVFSKQSSDSDDSDDVSDNDKSEDDEDSEENIRVTRTRRGKPKQKQNKKKKRKGRVLKSDSDSSVDEDLSPSKNKGRRKIRRILGDQELTEETRRARQLEEERRHRLLEKTQATYDEESVTVGDDTVKRIVLERNEDTGEALVEVHESLVGNLKPHQVEGIRFLYDCLFESVEKFKNGDKGNGALLAHCMGLGKSLQIIALLHTVMNCPSIGVTRFLIVAPVNTVYNWENEFEKWLEVDERIDVHVLADAGNNKRQRYAILKDWFKGGGVLIIGYDMYRNLTQFKNVRGKKQKKIITETLVDPGPDIVVCDEGHILRNDLSAISKALTKISTRRRVVLTGTPLQNNLSEYYVMVSFVKPNLLGTKKEFTNLFMNPILNGQCSNSTPVDVKVMKQRCHILHETLSGCVQRKDYSVLTPFLTPKHEYTIFVRLGEKQRKMYQHYLDTFVCGSLSDIRARGSSLFADYQCLMKIWTHPWAVKLEAIRRLERKTYDDINDFIDDDDDDDDDDDYDDAPATNKGEEGEEIKEPIWNTDSDSSDFGRSRTRRNRAVLDSDSDSSASDNQKSDNDDSVSTSTTAQTKSQPPAPKERNFPRSNRQASSASKSNKPTVSFNKEIFDAEGSSDEQASDGINNADASNDAGASNANADAAEDIVVVKPAEEPIRGMGNTRSGTQFKGNQNVEEEMPDVEEEWYDQFIKDEDESDIELSGKLVLLLEVVANAEIVGDKVLVFSQSLVSLDLIERVLGGGRIGGNDVNWFKGVDYFRMDGSTPAKTRQRYSEIFNDPDNTSARLFLISTRAGSLGVNLVAANRVIVFDCSWNPSHDVQSIFRVYRFGQTKPVYVYRFVTQGTMEEKIYDRQITKLAMSGRVVDEQQIERHFTDEEIRELYTLNAEEYKEDQEAATPKLPADPILAEVLVRQHPKWITKYQEHDLLLENIEDEKLSEEERKQAWDIYQAEKDSAVRGIAREEERVRYLQAVQQQQQQQAVMQNLQQQQQRHQLQQEIQRQLQQQQLLRQEQLRQQLGMQRQQQRQQIDHQIQKHQDAIRQMAQQMRAQYRNPPNYSVANIQRLPLQQNPRGVEEHYRNIQIMNLASLRNSTPRWAVAQHQPGTSNGRFMPLPGASNAPPQQPRGLVSALHSMNVPPVSHTPIVMGQAVRAEPPDTKPKITEIVDLS